MAAYATAAQLLTRYDSRRVAELNSDTGSPVTPTDPVSITTPVGAALYDASAMVDTALQAGKRYTRSVLAALIADADLSKGAPIVRAVCDIAYARLLIRRGIPAKEIANLAPGYVDAMQFISDLRNGLTVLDITANLNAGLPAAKLTNQWDPRTTSNWNRQLGFWPDKLDPAAYWPSWY